MSPAQAITAWLFLPANFMIFRENPAKSKYESQCILPLDHQQMDRQSTHYKYMTDNLNDVTLKLIQPGCHLNDLRYNEMIQKGAPAMHAFAKLSV
jgi:hypothetical protein